MNKIQIYIDNKLIDVDNEFSIVLTKENINTNVLDSEDEIFFSYSVDLPLTPNNKLIFGFIDNFDVIDKFNKLYPSKIYCGDFLIMDGYFYIENINNNNYITGNLYQAKSSILSNILTDKTLNSLEPINYKFTKLTDINTINSIIDNNIIKFPYILYNYPFNNVDTILTNKEQIISENNSINEYGLNNITPVYNVNKLINNIFNSHNLNVVGDIFNNPKFTDLYTTFSIESEDYIKNIKPNYYLNFNFSYNNFNENDNQRTKTMIINEIKDNFNVSADTIFKAYSNNKTIDIISDEYNLLSKGSSSEYNLRIDKDGWYYIKFKGNIELVENNEYITENSDNSLIGRGKPIVRGTCNSKFSTIEGFARNNTFANNIYELQLVKGEALQNVNLYSNNFTEPSNYLSLNENTIKNVNGNPNSIDAYVSNNTIRFGLNESANPLKTNTEVNIDNLVFASRWGCVRNSSTVTMDIDKNRINPQMTVYNIPNINRTSFVPTTGTNNIVKDSYFNLYTFDNSLPYINGNDYCETSAQVVYKDTDYMNYYGYVSCNNINESFDKEFDVIINQKNVSGLNPSISYVTNPDVGNKGTTEVEGVFYLNEGNILNLELVSQSIVGLDLFNYIEYGAPHIKCDGKFEMVYVEEQEDYDFYVNGIKPFEYYITNNEIFNFTSILPDTSCNDFLNNIINTFNLSLTQVNDNTYSLDSKIVNDNLLNNIIKLDDYISINDCSFNKIDIVNTIKLEFTNDIINEQGYTETKYEGSGIYKNITNTTFDEDIITSNSSYNWYTDIEFIDETDTSKNYIKSIPIISNQTKWSGNKPYSEVFSENWDINYNQRFLYLNDIDNNINIRYIDNDGNNQVLSLYSCTNEKNNLNLTFDRDIKNSISNTFFNITNTNQYEVEMEIFLPIVIFQSINSNTRFSLNGKLFKFKEIEGFDLSGQSTATLTLLSL